MTDTTYDTSQDMSYDIPDAVALPGLEDLDGPEPGFLEAEAAEAVDLDALSDALRAQLTTREVMRFELAAGITLDELVRTQAGQLAFMVWASRLRTDHAIGVDAALDLPLDEISAEVLALARRSPKGPRTDGGSPPSATSTGNGSSASPSSDSPTSNP